MLPFVSVSFDSAFEISYESVSVCPDSIPDEIVSAPFSASFFICFASSRIFDGRRFKLDFFNRFRAILCCRRVARVSTDI